MRTGALNSMKVRRTYLLGAPFGRYRYLRLPFGISASSDLFQMKINEIFEGLPGIAAIVNDILIYGHTRDEHDRNLCNILDRAQRKRHTL